MQKKPTKKRNRRTKRTRLSLESLEDRQLLDASGVWFSDSRISISFLPDGTQVGPKESELFAEFEHLGEPEAWQETIVRAFQTWARTTPFDIATVDDVGVPSGVRGNVKGDIRFGDVRVGAVPFERDDLFSTSISIDVFQGTWAGDVFFNSRVDVESLDQLFALALHEAGHIFAIEHSDAEGSPMNVDGPPIATALTKSDFDALQALHGSRPADPFELEVVVDSAEPVAPTDGTIDVPPDGDIPTPNDPGIFDPTDPDDGSGTENPGEDPPVDPGEDPPQDPPEEDPPNEDPPEDDITDPSDPVSTDHVINLEIGNPDSPTILFADIQSAQDTDTYRLVPTNTESSFVSIRLVTDEISSLRPTLKLFGDDQAELLSRSSSEGQSLMVDLREIEMPEDGFVVQVAADEGSAPYDVGGYSIVISKAAPEPGENLPEELSFCEGIASQTRNRSWSATRVNAHLGECNDLVAEHPNLPEDIIAAVLAFTDGEVLGPEPEDTTEHAFCGHEFLDDLYTCLVQGDINGDGQVDFIDFLNLSDNFGKTDAVREDGDLDGDGSVSFPDFLIVSRTFGKAPTFELADEPDRPFNPLFPFLP